MSLREEIFDIIYRDGDGNDFAEQCTDLIIEKIEKRIDEMIQIAEQERITREPFPFGRVATLNQVKEMLKQ